MFWLYRKALLGTLVLTRRDELMQIIAREAEKANPGMKIQACPGESPFKTKEQWGALTKRQLDITAPSRWTMRVGAT